MVNIILTIFVFLVTLFFYLHIQYHLKTSNDLEIYEVDYVSKQNLEEICDLRQPCLFESDENTKYAMQISNLSHLLDNYPVFEIKIRKSINHTHTYDKYNDTKDEDVYFSLPLHVANKLFNDDKKASYYSEGNGDFLSETGVYKKISKLDYHLRPSFVSNCLYDVMIGTNGAETPFRYDMNYRNYYFVTQGSIKVKLAPPTYGKYMNPENDHENFEFKSSINPWNPSDEHKLDFNKVKCLEITLNPGRFMYIPSYWWYSFKFGSETSVSTFKYRTYMNNVSIFPSLAMYTLQNMNIDRKCVPNINLKKINDKHIDRDNDNNDNDEHGEITNSTHIDELKTVVDQVPESGHETYAYNEIPDILVPKE